MKIGLFLFFLSKTLSNSFSSEIQATEVSQIIKAKTNSDLSNSINLLQEFKTSDDLCTKRLRHKEFPIACYQKLNLQKKLKILDENEIKNSLRVYDEICRKAEISGQEPNEIDLTEVSPKCQTYIRLALCKKSYQEGLVGNCELNR